MNQINEEVIKARQVVAGYKKYNKNTIEQCVEYNPKTKCRYFKKVSIDPESAGFKKEFGKKENKEKQPKTKYKSTPKITVKKIKAVPKKSQNKQKDFSETYEKVIKLTKEGKSISQIVEDLKVTHHTVSWHIKNWNSSKSMKEIQEENEEILNSIKSKAKLNGVDYCYSAWIGRKNHKMKHNLTSVEIIKRCTKMIQSGILEEVKEMYSRKHGRMYKIIK